VCNCKSTVICTYKQQKKYKHSYCQTNTPEASNSGHQNNTIKMLLLNDDVSMVFPAGRKWEREVPKSQADTTCTGRLARPPQDKQSHTTLPLTQLNYLIL
jgi:hypothetical protein